MSDQSVYFISNFTIFDPESYRAYEKGVFPLIKKHGGEFITFDDEPFTLEGSDPINGRIVMMKFPSEAVARAWYSDPEYQAIAEHRRAGTHSRFATLVHLPERN